jgi:deoxycytidylate deaminase
MLLAKSEANKSDLRFKLGAVIKYGKTKISAYNVNKTHPKFGCGRYSTLHSESYCILRAVSLGVDISGCIMYVYRSGGLNSRPCEDCQKLIKKYKIKKVIYTKGN